MVTPANLRKLAVVVVFSELAFLSAGRLVIQGAPDLSAAFSTHIALFAGLIAFVAIPVASGVVVGRWDKGSIARLALTGAVGVIVGSVFWLVLGRVLGLPSQNSSLVVLLWRTLGFGTIVGIWILGLGRLIIAKN